MNPLYLGLNIFWTGCAALLLYFKRKDITIQWKLLIPSLLLITLFFSFWSIAYIALDVWKLDKRLYCGLFFSLLPLEDVLSVFSLTFLITSLYEVSFIIYPKNPLAKIHRWIGLTIVAALVYFLSYSWRSIYASVPAILLILFFLQNLLYNYRWAGRFMLCTIVFTPIIMLHRNLVIGAGYLEINPQEISGISLLKMPLADLMFYGLASFMNIWLYESFKQLAGRKRRIKSKREKENTQEESSETQSE